MRTPESANPDAVFIANRDDQCAKCSGPVCRGEHIRLEAGKPVCARCAGVDTLVFLGSGDAALTRRAITHTGKKYPVLSFSRARKRCERQGVLVTQAALDQAGGECEADAPERERSREAAAKRRETREAEYLDAFARKIRALYPAAPVGVETEIAAHACRKHSGRVGRSSAAKGLDPGLSIWRSGPTSATSTPATMAFWREDSSKRMPGNRSRALTAGVAAIERTVGGEATNISGLGLSFQFPSLRDSETEETQPTQRVVDRLRRPPPPRPACV